MISKMVLSAKSLSTNITAVWPLISVCPLMDQEVVRLGELPVTELTDELLLWPAGGPSGASSSWGLHPVRWQERTAGTTAELGEVEIFLGGAEGHG